MVSRSLVSMPRSTVARLGHARGRLTFLRSTNLRLVIRGRHSIAREMPTSAHLPSPSLRRQRSWLRACRPTSLSPSPPMVAVTTAQRPRSAELRLRSSMTRTPSPPMPTPAARSTTTSTLPGRSLRRAAVTRSCSRARRMAGHLQQSSAHQSRLQQYPCWRTPGRNGEGWS